ncbi:MAG: hypothetical protein ACI352_00915 [Elusimicrobiaceae bacterium]
MKLFIRLLLATALTFSYPMLSLAQGKTSAQDYFGVPVGAQTTKLSAVYPYFKEVTVSKQFVEKQKTADPVRHELNVIDGKIRKLEMEKMNREQRQHLLERTAPQDNTRVVRPIIPERLIKKSKGIDQALQRSRLSQEEKEIANLKQRRTELMKKLNASGLSRNPSGDKNFSRLSAQAKINEAFAIYKQSADMLAYEQLPDFKKSPKQVQALIAKELNSINERLKYGPAYKSFVSLQKEIDRINKNKLYDNILMTLFTFATLYKFKGVSIAAPSSALAFWSLPRFAYYGEKIVNFLGVIAIYAAIETANLNAVHASFEEMLTRFTALEDNMAFLQKLIKDGETNVFGKLKDPIPSAWSKDPYDTVHQTALRRLYGLRVVDTYLRYSTVHYKFDLAMLDVFNLFSDQQNVVFDVNVFNQYKAQDGEWVQVPGKSNSLKINASSSLVDRGRNNNPSLLIQNLSKLPAFIYYKKTYYQNVGDRKTPIMIPVNPMGIIRTKNGILMDCNYNNIGGNIGNYFTPDGKNMEFLLDGDYYMRIEPVTKVYNEGYRGKPKTYVFEDINTTEHSCEELSKKPNIV